MLLNIFPLVSAALGIVLVFYGRFGRRSKLVERLRAEVGRRSQQGQDSSRWKRRDFRTQLLASLGAIGQRAPLLSAAQRSEVGEKLVRAGFRSAQYMLMMAALVLFSVCTSLGLSLMFVRPLLNGNQLLGIVLCVGSVYLGLLLPRLVLDWLVLRRQRSIERSLPDALDLLVICTNSGLGLNSAITRVASEIEMVSPALADELGLTASELQLSNDTDAVLKNLAKRIKLDSVDSLVNTLTQSRQYGTAITQSLRILAASERTARMMRLEEAAAKLAVKITLPMMLFILPTVLIVAAGPAVLGLMEYFANR